jgi:hypothetical protein
VARVNSSLDDEDANRLGGSGDAALIVGNRAVRGEGKGSAADDEDGDMDIDGARLMTVVPAIIIRFS